MAYENLKQKLINGEKLSDEERKQLVEAIAGWTRGFDVANAGAEDIQGHFDTILEHLEANKKDLKDILDLDQDKLSILQDYKSAVKRKIDMVLEAEEMDEEELDRLKKLYRLVTHQLKEQQRFNQGLQKGQAAAERLLSATLGLTTEWSSLSSPKGVAQFGKGIVSGLKDAAHYSNVFAALVSKLFERFMIADRLRSEFFRETGQSLNLDMMSKEVAKMDAISADNRTLFKQVRSAQMRSFKGFVDLSADQQSAMTQTGAVLEQYGISAVQQAQLHIMFSETEGRSMNASLEAQRQLATAAGEIGVVPGKFAQDMIDSYPMLSRYGKEADKIFKEMAAQAYKMDIELSKMISLEDRLDTIEGAAQFAQNAAILMNGPAISYQALLAARGAEKMDYIRQMVDITGKTRREKDAFAKQMGFSGAGELIRALETEQESIDTAKTGVQTKAMSLDELSGKIVDNMDFATTLMAQVNAAIDELYEWLFGGDGTQQGILNTLKGLASSMVDILTILGTLAAMRAVLAPLALKGTGAMPLIGYIMNRGPGGLGRGLMRGLAGGTLLAGGAIMGGAAMDMTGATEAMLGEGATLNVIKAFSDNRGSTNLSMSDRPGTKVNNSSSTRGGNSTVNIKSPGVRTSGPSASRGSSRTPSPMRRANNPTSVASVGRGGSGGGSYGGGGLTGITARGRARDASPDTNIALMGDTSSGPVTMKARFAPGSMSTPRPIGGPNADLSNYVQPVFHKNDRFYAAKPGGALVLAIEELIALINEDIEFQKTQASSGNKIEISPFEFGKAMQTGLEATNLTSS